MSSVFYWCGSWKVMKCINPIPTDIGMPIMILGIKLTKIDDMCRAINPLEPSPCSPDKLLGRKMKSQFLNTFFDFLRLLFLVHFFYLKWWVVIIIFFFLVIIKNLQNTRLVQLFSDSCYINNYQIILKCPSLLTIYHVRSRIRTNIPHLLLDAILFEHFNKLIGNVDASMGFRKMSAT